MSSASVDGQPIVRDFAVEAREPPMDHPKDNSAAGSTDKQAAAEDLKTMEESHTPATTGYYSTTGTGLEGDPALKAQKIIRQVEYYFSDDNLPKDAHLLGLIKAGEGAVSLDNIMRFGAMKELKPKSDVKEALKHSTLVELTADGKRIRRKYPLNKPITVVPRIPNHQKPKYQVPKEKPWLTKGMMKPTGFEKYVTDGPIKSKEYARDREDYDPEISFPQRIETGITRFTARRKMHQETRQIFTKFMIYGGMDAGQKMFTGPVDTENLTKKEIADLSSEFGVSESVMDGFDEQEGTTWVVDFEATAKGFLSSEFLSMAAWYETKRIMTATNILRNFYNYLLHHDVCNEYVDQLHAAGKVCDLAEEELPKLAIVDRSLPGGFNVACSILFGGNYADTQSGIGDWATEGEELNWSKEEAKKVFCAGIAAWASDDQLLVVEDVLSHGKQVKVVSEVEIGLEVVSTELMTDDAKEVYGDPRLANTFVRPMGRMHCKLWDVPNAPPVDIPAQSVGIAKCQTYEFLVDEETLNHCFPGLKMEACVMELAIGVKWIDYVQTTYPSFHTWLTNETIRDWKEPGPAKDRMASHQEDEDGIGAVRDGEDAADDDRPD